MKKEVLDKLLKSDCGIYKLKKESEAIYTKEYNMAQQFERHTGGEMYENIEIIYLGIIDGYSFLYKFVGEDKMHKIILEPYESASDFIHKRFDLIN